MPTITETLRDAWPVRVDDAKAARALFDSWCDKGLPRVPGMGTTERLAMRMHVGKSIEQAAASEYVYRWALAIKAPDQCNAAGRRSYDLRDRDSRACVSIFGAPHAIGM